MASVPDNALAIEFKGFFTVIYTDAEGYVKWLNFSGNESTIDAPKYKIHNSIQADGKGTIQAHNGQVALVIFYADKTEKTVCFNLYYISMGTADNHSVRQLSASAPLSEVAAGTATLIWASGDKVIGANNPTPAGFNANNYVAADHSPLAAACNGTTIRVYFRKKGSNDLTVAYTEANSAINLAKIPWKDRIAYSGNF